MTTTFFASPDLIHGTRLRLPADEAKHALRVLRHRAGDVVEVVDGNGGWYRVRLDSAGGDGASGEILESARDVGEPAYELTLAVGVVKNPSRLETLVEKAVELGVRRIIPLETERTERVRLRPERLERIALAAMKQCGRSRMPTVSAAITLERFLAGSPEGRLLICHEGADRERAIGSMLDRDEARQLTVLVGPEGGFTEEEVASAARAGFEVVSLGIRRLRAETAGIAVAASVHLHFESTLGEKARRR